MEGIEAGSKVFLLDEDTSATNFMVRDAFMQHVISREKEPITPFLERARDLYEKEGISTILVAGSSGAFFPYCRYRDPDGQLYTGRYHRKSPGTLQGLSFK